MGDDAASQTYVRMKGKAIEEMGMYSRTILKPKDLNEKDLLRIIDELNADPQVHGILVQLPLPPHINEWNVLVRIDPRKDVDAFHPFNVGRMLIGDQTGFMPATPYGIQELLIRSGNAPSGKHVVILGRSNIVGKPLAAMLMQKDDRANATVTICHSKTENLADITRTADILISAMGAGAAFVTADMVKPGRRGHRCRCRTGCPTRVPPGAIDSWATWTSKSGEGQGGRHHASTGRGRSNDHRHAAAEHHQGGRDDPGRLIVHRLSIL